jgi:polysaccharide biosynthesis protein PslH
LESLVVTRLALHPPAGGAPLRVSQMINALSRIGPVGVFTVAPEQQALEPHPSASSWVHISRSRGGGRDLIRRVARALRCRSWFLAPRGHATAAALHSPQAAATLRGIVADRNPELILIEELWLYPYLRTLAGSRAKVVYDAHNVEGLLRESLVGSKDSKQRSRDTLLSTRTRRAERQLCQSVDAVWVCSEIDGEAIRNLYGRAISTHVVPNTVDHLAYADIRKSRANQQRARSADAFTIVFPAVFAYPPNAVAAEFFIQHVFPLIRTQINDVRLLLVGRSPTATLFAAASASGGAIEVTGAVPSIGPYFSAADVIVVPLLHGGGTRLKILEAFAAKVPVVSTTKGAEGLNAAHGEHLLIADTAEELAQAALKLAREPQTAQALAESAYALVLRDYSSDALHRTLSIAVGSLGLADARLVENA